MATVSSSYHIEMTPSDCGYYDRFVIQVTIKEIAQNRPMDGKKTFKGKKKTFKLSKLMVFFYFSGSFK